MKGMSGSAVGLKRTGIGDDGRMIRDVERRMGSWTRGEGGQ